MSDEILTVDKNLFAHDLAIVAILKNEAPYLREWLDYHLLAGVDHFYLYDNDSSDAYDEIITPYVAAGLVTSKKFSGGSAQFAAYLDAVLNYRFQCRRMAFIDGDEFIYPKSNRSVAEVVEEILSRTSAAGLAINWQLFGSSGEVKVDHSRGVLERFTRRAPVDWVVPIPNRDIPGGNAQVKTVANPRRIAFFTSAHFPIYFEGNYSVNERGGVVPNYCNEPVTTKKIAINHYNVKSREEFRLKLSKGRADKAGNYFNATWFDLYDRNEIFDDGILKYRATRAENFSLESDAAKVQRVINALNETLSRYAVDELFDLETALICRAASNYLGLKIHEEASLAAILKSLDEICFVESRLLISELPTILTLPYPIVRELREACLQILQQMIDFARYRNDWMDFVELDYIQRLLKLIKI